jgi:PAS domain S-box-containing protein/putative nucleotidyltransferase with HDIG domain
MNTVDQPLGRRGAMARDRTEETQARLAAIVASTSDAVFTKDLDDIITSWNAGAERMYGYSADEIIGHDVEILAPPDRGGEPAELTSRAIAGEPVSNVETLRVRKDGTMIDVSLTLSLIRDDSGKVTEISVIDRDISARKRAEDVQRRVDRELRAVSHCNHALLHAADEQQLLNDICRIVCDDAGYRMAWVGLAGNDAAKTVRPVAVAGLEDGYLTGTEVTWSDTEHGRGPTGTTIREGRTVYTQDFATDPRMALWLESALQRGYRSSIALPLKNANAEAFGALTIYSGEPDAFTEGEIRLLEEMAADLAFGMIALRTAKERQRAEDALRESQMELKEAQRIAHIGSWDWDADNDTIVWSPEYYRIYGLDPAKPAPDYAEHLKAYTAESGERLDAAVARAMETGESYELDLELARPTSSTRWVAARGEAKRNANGRIWGLRGTAQSITARKNAEEALREAGLYARSLIEASVDPLVTIGTDGRITDANRATEQAAGLPRAKLIGTDFADCFTEPERARAGYLRVLEEGTLRDFPLTLRNASGSTMNVLYNATTFVDAEGELQGVFAAARDITRLEKSEAETKTALFEMMETIALTVEIRDPFTSGHQRRVAELASAIAERMGLETTVAEGVRAGALIHDIGKIQIPAEILSKPGSLSKFEWQIDQMHPSVGAEIVHGVHTPWPIEQMILQHHERLDGSGYPKKLKGDQIVLEARILGVADVVEAMSYHRSYRPACGIDAALDQIARGRGTMFDERVVDTCLALFEEKAFEFSPAS